MYASKRTCLSRILAAALSAMLCSCAHVDNSGPQSRATNADPVIRAIQGVKDQFAPVSRLAIFNVGAQRQGGELVLTGEVDRAESRIETVRTVERTGAKVTDHIKVLPSATKTASGPCCDPAASSSASEVK